MLARKIIFKIPLDRLTQSAIDERNRQVGSAIKEAYSYRHGPASSNSFSRPDYFSSYTFVSELEKHCWAYDGAARNARLPVQGMCLAEDDAESLNASLEPYDLNKQQDLFAVVQNAERRARRIPIRGVHFGSYSHAELLSQELYESGWNWKP